ncbi:MAG: amino acid permease [Gammaproteobacteria bacterium]
MTTTDTQPAVENLDQDAISARESGLRRSVSARQMAMIALGSSIGTGLFLGAGIAIATAGPAVLISYVIGAVIALIMMYSLAELTVVHPTAGAFGAQAEYYLGGGAGYVTRYMYWSAQVLAIGGEATAIGLYMGFWFPAVPHVVWVAGAAAVLIALNASNVKNFGRAEYWFTTIKITAIIAFIVAGLVLIFRNFAGVHGVNNLYSDGGFMPHGWTGVWFAVLMAVFSYYGVEVVAVSAGETSEPKKNIPKAFRLQVVRLIVFYLLSLSVMLAIVPWTDTGAVTVSQSPFVLTLDKLGFPLATGVMNFVILTAALSSMNANLYVSTRMIFSLARSGQGPALLGRVTQKHGIPAGALGFSSIGIIVALALNVYTPAAFNILFGVSIFGGIFVWIMILVTFIAYRRSPNHARASFKAPFSPWLQVLGIALLGAVLVTMAFEPSWRFAWFVGPPYIIFLFIVYWLFYRKRKPRAERDGSAQLE